MKSAAISVALFCACGAFAGGSRQFPLGEVELTGSVFLERRDVDEKYLLEVVDADRLPEGEGNDHQDYGAGIDQEGPQGQDKNALLVLRHAHRRFY